jgi:hypothetical protein
MKKLVQMSRSYRKADARMSVNERINQCALIIYRTHAYLSRYGSRISSYARSRSLQIIMSAESELSQLVTKWKF